MADGAGYGAEGAESQAPAAEEDVPPPEPLDPSKPILYHPQWAGRAELTRLIAAAGGLELQEAPPPEELEVFGSDGSVPVFSHDDLQISQGFAIEQYVSGIADGFVDLDDNHRAIDNMFCRIKDDMLNQLQSVMTGMLENEEKREAGPQKIVAICEKWFPMIEGRIPEDGFINGFEYPTAADLALVNISKAYAPFGTAYRIAQRFCDVDVAAKFSKFSRHVDRVAEYAPVKEYLGRTRTMAATAKDIDVSHLAEVQEVALKISELAREVAELWHQVDCPIPDFAVVWLHGIGESELYWQEFFDLLDLTKPEELGELRWIMPRADMTPCTARGGAPTLQWFDTYEFPVSVVVPSVPNRDRKEESFEEIQKAVERVHDAVIALEVEGVDAKNIVIAGFGQGGALAAHAATSYPKALAGCCMLSGYVPRIEEMQLAATEPGLNTKLLWLHGIHDGLVQTDAATLQAKKLLDLGIRLDFRLSFDYGHETCEQQVQTFRGWLIRTLNPPKPPTEDREEEDGSRQPSRRGSAANSRRGSAANSRRQSVAESRRQSVAKAEEQDTAVTNEGPTAPVDEVPQ